jgi:molybdenum cofactor biosynthesis protein B
MAYEQHLQSAKDIVARCAVITLSDTRTPETDGSGQLIHRLLSETAHPVAHYQIVKDNPTELTPLLDKLLADPGIDVILTNGGTGIARRDQTISVIEKIIDQSLPGFGELFRMLSWEQIGAGAMMSRAAGGIAKGKPLFAMPGSSKAVELAMRKLILPQLGHLLFELRKQS